MGTGNTQPRGVGNIEPNVTYQPNPADANNDVVGILKNIEKYCKQIANAVAFDTIMQEIDLASVLTASNNYTYTFNVYQPYNAVINAMNINTGTWLGMWFSSSANGDPDLTFQTVGSPERLPFPTRNDNQITIQLVGGNLISGTIYVCLMRN